MTKVPDEQAGSGLDKPQPKGLLEKIGDRVKSALPQAKREAPQESDTGKDTADRLPE